MSHRGSGCRRGAGTPSACWPNTRRHRCRGDHAPVAGTLEPLVVNCAGLGARELVGDASMYPVRGQIVRVRNPGLTMSVRDELHPGGRAYVHPRTTDCILGGTLDVAMGHHTRPCRRCGGPGAVYRPRSPTARCGGSRAHRRAATGPPDRSPRGGRAAEIRCESCAQLRARRLGHHVVLGLRPRGHRSRRPTSPAGRRVSGYIRRAHRSRRSWCFPHRDSG